MKKLMCVLLTLCLLLGLMAGCGDSENGFEGSGNDLDPFGSVQPEAPVQSENNPGNGNNTITTTSNPSPQVTMPSINNGDDKPATIKEEDTGTAGGNSGTGSSGGGVTQADTGSNSGSGNSGGSGSGSDSGNSGSGSGGSGGNSGSGSGGNSGGSSGGSTPAPTQRPQTMMQAYGDALDDIADNGVLPDGTPTGGANTQYAVADINGDGVSELIIRCPGVGEQIYNYDGAGGVYKLDTMPSGTTYYSDGTATVPGGPSGAYSGAGVSPYTVYSCEGGVYSKVGSVDGWDSSLSEEEDGTNSFPVGADLDGNGYVYLIYVSGDDGMQIADDAEYFAWRSAVIGGSAVTPGFQTVTSESGASLR